MIQQIEIKNFQSHRKTKLDFDPGVNTILGSSDSGKTSIIRALRWLVWNRPLGEAFRSHWGGDISVVLETDDCRVVRFKGKEDRYLLTDSKGGELEFKAFGTEPPSEIAKALNFSDLNIQNQHDNAFLISNNPGEVARHFNKIARIDQIDSSLKAVERWVRDLNQEVKAQESNIEDYQTQLEGYEYLDKMEIDVEALEHLQSERDKTGRQLNELSGIINKLEEVEEQIEEGSILLPAEKDVDILLDQYQTQDRLVTDYKELKELCLDILQISDQIKENQELIQDEEQINDVLDLYRIKKEIEEKANKFKNLSKEFFDVEMKIAHQQDTLTELEKSWHENMPEICPLCGK